jgi:hypothetical protein
LGGTGRWRDSRSGWEGLVDGDSVDGGWEGLVDGNTVDSGGTGLADGSIVGDVERCSCGFALTWLGTSPVYFMLLYGTIRKPNGGPTYLR